MSQRVHWAVQVRECDDPVHVGLESSFDEDTECEPPESTGELPVLGQCDGCGRGDYKLVLDVVSTVRCSDCGAKYPLRLYDEDEIVW